jgi:glycosyltransferase involved in cell wall biosynthesis
MKIGIDVRLWSETGVGRYIRNLIKNLHNIDLENEYVLFCKSSDVSSIKYYVSSTNWKIVESNIQWHSLKEQVKFPQILNREHLDLMHFPYFSLPVLYQKPFIVTVHDLIIYHYPTGKASTLPLPLYKMKHYGYKKIVGQAVRKARRVIVPLDAVKTDLVKTLHINEEKICVTNEGIDDGLITQSITHEEILPYDNDFFLYVGNAYPHKNIETLLKAFIRFKQEASEKQTKLILVGKEDFFYSKLQKNLDNNNLKDIRILHNVGDNMLRELYTHALAVVAPSFMEGFGLVPLEAMANNCLVIASDIPAHREVCKDAAIYFDPLKAGELLTSLTKVLSLDAQSKKLYTFKGLEESKHFSWRKMAEETIAVYESSL